MSGHSQARQSNLRDSSMVSMARGYYHVTCIVSMDCVLPCRFKHAGDEVVQWYRQNVLVHSFQNGSDMLDQQNKQYRSRTSIFREQLPNGNASLLLKHSDIQDKGRYRCQVHSALGDQESFVITKLEAPIQFLSLRMTRPSGFDEVSCSSQDIYPAPQLWWSTDPAVPFDTLKPTTRKVANRQGLYSVESAQKRLGNLSDFTYICTLSSYYGTQTWKASLKEREISSVSGKGLTIPCLAPTKLLNFNLTWTFTRANKSEVILTFDSLTRHTSSHWKNWARVDPDQVLSGNGSLWLHNVDNSAQTGTYTCDFSAFQIRQQVHNHVGFFALNTGGNQSSLWVIAVVTAALVLLIAGMIMYASLRDKCSLPNRTTEDAIEIQHMRRDTDENKTLTESKSCDIKL
ncbi:hypothetical protein AAFF_G00102530 [Aldrovandia affinis]|uniref:Ig-like domain-containing protein n=1 Tax=Aldrovandia affinis TaxID=143900 RepID=A0AAD7RUN3_9TELE|nr:hypothetical protein AAFF_G00102530 [Aldrovandia affinis]